MNKKTKNDMDEVKDIDSIFKSRYHGASNIKGIRFQILYSIFKSFDLFERSGAEYLTLKGIEDLDLIGLMYGNEHIQVKTSKNIWYWNNLKGIIQNFLEVHRVNRKSKFSIVIGAEAHEDIINLMNYGTFSSEKNEKIKNKFLKLFDGLNASKEETEYILDNLNIIVISEKSLLKQLKIKLTDLFRIGSASLEIYLSVLVSKFLDCATARSSITRFDIEDIKITIEENLSREKQYLAYGKGLIEKISWEKDNKIEDFYEGKGTRSGHIVANIDYKREFWQEKIDKAINSTKICIIRSSSGQGKSALLYRYAYEKWPADNTFTIRKINSEDDVQHIINYLKFRASLGLPLLVLIDDVSWQKRLWTSIVSECAALNIHILVTIRNEDWFRFSKENLSDYEIIEPILNMDEVNEIFKVFQSKNKIHKSVLSAEWAYEKIDQPKLLIEYIYLITHGRMLHERLKDQINQIVTKKENNAKIEILRRSTLAHVLGTSVSAEIILNDINCEEDGQFLLKSLSDEYLTIDDQGYLKELHWVRSEHIAKILHESYPKVYKTALKSFDAIPKDDVSNFIRNGICMDDLEQEHFIDGLVQKTKTLDIEIILAIIDGVFEAGEQLFFDYNKEIFDEAYDFSGPSGPHLMHSEFVQFGKLDILTQFGSILGDKGHNFIKLKKIASKAKKIPRGLDLSKEFLRKFDQIFDSNRFNESLWQMGILLDWYSICDVEMKSWPAIQNKFIKSDTVLTMPLNELSNFTQGIYRYDEEAYYEWYSKNKDELIYYLKLQTNSLKLNLDESKISIEYIPFDDNFNLKIPGEVLEFLRSIVPFCQNYESKGIWSLPFGLTPNVDETYKKIPSENLHFKSDMYKNSVLGGIIWEYYLPDSYYVLERSWYSFRKSALFFVKEFSKELKNLLLKKNYNFQKVFADENSSSLFEINKKTPNLPLQTNSSIREDFASSAQEFGTNFRNFFDQIIIYVLERSEEEGRLALINFWTAEKKLLDLQDVFDKVYNIYPDYFNSKKLNQPEIRYYKECGELLDIWINNPPKWLSNSHVKPPRTLINYLKRIKAKKRKLIISKVEKSLFELKNEGIEVILPKDIYLDPPLRYLTFAFSFNDFELLDSVFGTIVKKLMDIVDLTDFFCIIPLFRGKIYIKGGYQISSNQIRELNQGEVEKNWEALVPHYIPKEMFSFLDGFEFQESPLILLQNYTGVMTALNIIIDYNNNLNVFKESNNNFELDLYQKNIKILGKFLEDIKNKVHVITEYLQDNFSEFKEEKNYELLFNLLEDIENSSVNDLKNIKTLNGNITEVRSYFINVLNLKDIT